MTILLVEEDNKARKHVRKLLEVHGHTVIEAWSVSQAQILIEKHEKEIERVLTGFQIGDGSGLDVILFFRGRNNPVRACVLSCEPAGGDLEHSTLALGADAYVEKPFVIAKLFAALGI
jgi:two-component system copper resistance phosphate regulon response regulator CusR